MATPPIVNKLNYPPFVIGHKPLGTYPQDTQGPRPADDHPGNPVAPPSVAGGRTSPATGTPHTTVAPQPTK
jgi:hypothetical protein